MPKECNDGVQKVDTSSLSKNTEFITEIESFSSDGAGVCHIEGRAVFIPGVIPGEKCRIKILKVTNTAVYGKCMEILSPSESRTEPDCPYYRLCGGCCTRHMSYEKEAQFKLDKVNNCLVHIGKQNVLADEIITADSRVRYRNKSIYTVSNKNGELVSGFFREHSHDVIDIEDCLIQSELSNKITRYFLNLMKEYNVSSYDESTCKGVIRHLFLRNGIRSKDLVLCIVARTGLGSATSSIVEKLVCTFPELTGIVLNVNKTKGNTVLAGDFYTLWGSSDMTDVLCENTYCISPQAFYQINPIQAEKLYNQAVEWAVTSPKDFVLDLYCGAGTITLCLAKKAAKVIGAEIVPDAIENAKANAIRNGVSNAEFICADAKDASLLFKSQGLTPNAIVVDPPRKGLNPDVIRDIVEMNPQRIVYVSCNPATLARDLKLFTELSYRVQMVKAVDMFPGTEHVETVCLLTSVKGQPHIDFTLDIEELSKTPRTTATYPELKAYVLDKYGFKVSSLYIGQIKTKCGLEKRENYNKGEGKSKELICPPEKEEAILDAFRHFGMII